MRLNVDSPGLTTGKLTARFLSLDSDSMIEGKVKKPQLKQLRLNIKQMEEISTLAAPTAC